MYQKRLEFEASEKGKEEQEKYRSTPPWSWRPAVPITEVTNQPPAFEWVPSFDVDKFGRISVLKCTSWRVEEYTLELAECVVGLQSFTEDKHLFSCSGTIVEFLKGVGCVVTSASLVKLPHQDEIADKLKVNVCLPSGETLEGSVSNVDFCYNICVVHVRSTSQLPAKRFSADTTFFNFDDCHSKDVVALGRLCKRWSLNVASGKLTPRRSQFDCEELLVSSCRISKRGVGGPLMDFDGNIIGMNFYDKKETPFVPGFIMLKCLQHFNDFGRVIRPLHGLRVKTLHEEQLTVLEKIHLVFPGVCGVIVEKVQVPSPEHSEIKAGDSGVMVDKIEVHSPEHSEIKVGDIITHVDGIPFSSAAEFGGILLDTCGQHMLERQKLGLPENDNQMSTVISLKFDVKTQRGRKSEKTTRTINVDKFTPSGKLNRWPLGRAYLLRRIENGILYTEERYG
ncbi:uncharacterized protein [Aegilops tauschii subsp. strangulata]|uniref:PDZ domain-containing protein n=5 Tax=Aegilops tauschii subsp. strangulata TaxID=200361 RepID=A0A453KV12_AEGTS